MLDADALSRGLPTRRSRGAKFYSGRVGKRLEHNAATLRGRKEPFQVLLRHRVREVERQADVREPGRRVAIDTHRASKIEIAFRSYGAIDLYPAICRNRPERHACAGDERLEQHVT